MLFILRQLRRLELRKRSGQYFLYAFGEIVLIVVGILIALQIQNWNQQRLDRVEERYLLIELMDNLNQEAERFEGGLVGINNQVKCLEVIQGYYKDESYTKDELEKYLSHYMASFLFQPITSAYETMKATGTGFSTRPLKAELVDYYDRMQPRLLFLIQTQQEIIATEVRPFLMKHLESFKIFERAVVKDVENPEFKETLFQQVMYFEGLFQTIRSDIQDNLSKNREILAMVEQELER